jgi:hypothetical protein
MQCALCGHEDTTSLVAHIREKHGLKIYLNLFPDLPIVNQDLFTAIENAVYFSYQDDTEGLSDITDMEREEILISSRNNMPFRSEIIQTPDF